MPRSPTLAAAAAALLAACAPGPGGEGGAVGAFATACATLERSAALSAAARLGFVPARRAGLPEASVARAEARGATVLARRPAPDRTELLFWSDAPHCELAATGVGAAEAEAGFRRALGALAAAPGGGRAVALAAPGDVARLPVGADGRRVAAMAIVAPPGGDARRGGRLLVLRVPAAEGAADQPVVLVARAVAASAGAGAAPDSELKDFPAR